MTVLRIGICDDLADARLVLRSALERILEIRKIQGQFFEFSSGETLLRWYDHYAGELDVVFLDMELHELDGMETARRLRAADAGLQLVFVTGYADHVFDGYSVGALGYLMKRRNKSSWRRCWIGPRRHWYGIWTEPIFAAAGILTTVSPSPTSFILPLTGGRSGASRRDGPTPFTANWTRWHRR